MYAEKGNYTILPLILAIMIILSVGFPSDVNAQQDPPLVHSGKRHLLDGELDQAIINFSEHLKMHGFNRDAYYWRAHCLIQQDYLDEAMEDLKYVLQYHPDDPVVMDALGYAYNQRGQYLEAINWFNQAIVHDHENAIFYNNRGMSYYYLEKYSSAFYDFNKAILLDSTFAEAYSNRGSARYNNQNIAAATNIDLRKAEEDFSRALELDHALLSAYRNRGIIRFHLEKYTESFLDLQKAIYLNPEDPIIYFHMGNLMMAREKHSEAVTYFNECLKRNQKMTEAMHNRALAYIQLNEFDLARYDYEVLIENFDDQRGTCFYLLARTYAMQENQKLAYSYLKQARKYGFYKDEANKSKAYNDPLLKKYWEEEEDFMKLWEKIKKS